MITEKEKAVILRYARKYNVSSVVLFGSSITKGKDYNDIDIGVKGIEPGLFFRFYGDLLKHLSKPVDIVDISNKSLFTTLIEETGFKIHG